MAKDYFETKLQYMDKNVEKTITLYSVNSMQPTFSFNMAVQEGLNVSFPMAITSTGINAPTFVLAGEILCGANQRIIDDKTGIEVTKNTLADLWEIIKNHNKPFKIYAFRLSANNPITHPTETKDYFLATLNSIQFQPTTRYKGEYVGDLFSYTMTFKLTGE